MSALHWPSRERIAPLRTYQRLGFALLSADIVAKRFWTLEQRTFSRSPTNAEYLGYQRIAIR
jgi:hypothetical protein